MAFPREDPPQEIPQHQAANPSEPASPSGDDVLVMDEIRLRSYLDAALGGILAVNGDGRIVYMNGHTEQMFGYVRPEILGHNLTVLIPQRFHENYAAGLRAYFAAPSVRMLGMDLGLVARRKDGQEFPVEIGLSFVQGEEGVIALGFITEVTDRKRVLDELSRTGAELRRSNTELEHFAHLASHDLREPLRVIANYLKLLERRCHENLDAEAREYIEVAERSALRMKSQIEDLLSYSRIGKMAPALHRVPAERILQTAVDNLSAAIHERSAVVTWDPLPDIVADPGLLAEVFQNLIANGIKFHTDGAPRVHVSATQRDSEWVFSVRDNGIGIEPRQSHRIFQLFERLHSYDEFPGTGVGLVIAQKILERHNGRIWFESNPGEGATFYFSIPGAPAAEQYSIGLPA